MTEVHRYQVVTMLSAAGATIGYDPHGPEVVMASAFDEATRLFLDAAERCVASERREKELQQRLTAADERADVLAGHYFELKEAVQQLLSDAIDADGAGEMVVQRADIDELRPLIAALNLAESANPPACAWSHDAIGIWTGSCGTKWAFTDDAPIENGMRFCQSCGKTLVVEGEGDDA